MRKKIIHRFDGTPYLIRYYVFKCRKFQVVLHHILLSDYSCLHDHPWKFISIILWRGYWERTPIGSPTDIGLVEKKWYGIGSVLRRPARWVHALQLPEGKTAWSLVIMFKRERRWGFWTKKGWQYYMKYDPKHEICE